jgi:hypothetical protein
MTFAPNQNLGFEYLPHDLSILIFWHSLALSTLFLLDIKALIEIQELLL